MKNVIYQLWHPTSNVEEATLLLLRQKGVRVSGETIRQRLQSHPHYPSLAAVSDVIRHYGVESMALRVHDPLALQKYEGYFLVQIKTKDGKDLLGLVNDCTGEWADWYDPRSHKRDIIHRQEFSQLATGIVLLPEASTPRHEKNYKSKMMQSAAKEVIETTMALALPAFAMAALMFSPTSWFLTALTITALLGFIIGLLIMLYEYNEQAPLLSHLCGRGKSVDCGSVIRSGASRLLGIPWAVIGTAYFAGFVLYLGLFSCCSDALFVLAVTHTLALPYAAYSVYYQARIAHHWCTLCLVEQAAILLTFCLLLFSGAYRVPAIIHPYTAFLLAVCFFCAFVAVYLLWMASEEHKAHADSERRMRRLKYDKNVFWTLLRKGRKMEMPASDMGITLGNPEGSIHIVEVCQPYCGHCANAQMVLQHIAEANKDVRLQIVFLADPDAEYYQELPIDLFLSLYHEGAEMEDILSEWYATPNNDVTSFTEQHPAKRRFTAENNDEAKRMYDFCEKAEVIGTPTVFINGHQLPPTYQIEELQYTLL